ncbi:MAG TPA: outer membrane beta-barrel protein [Sphingomicrobium sp.]
MSAQTCLGAARYSAGPMRVGGGFSTTDGAKSYGLNFGVGAKVGPFASANLSRAEYSDADVSSRAVGIGAGYAIDVNPTHTVQFCPQASLTHQSGPDIDVGTSTMSTSANAFAFGGAFGGSVPVTPTLDLVPFGAASYVISRATVTFGGTSESDSQDYADIELGAGFVLNKTLTLQPSIAIPVGLDGAKSSFQLAVAFNFGTPKH